MSLARILRLDRTKEVLKIGQAAERSKVKNQLAGPES